MAKAIRGQYVGRTMAILLLAGLLVLAASMFVVWHAATIGDRVNTPAISTSRDGGSSVARDPAIERHAEVVARYNQDNPR